VTALGLFNYWAVVVLMMVGFYTLISRDNLVKKIIGLNIFQTSVIMMYVSFGKITGGTAPILIDSGDHGGEDGHAAADAGHEATADGGHDATDAVGDVVMGAADGAAQVANDAAHAATQASEILYSNPIPHVLMLTAIVVGVATLALGLSLIVRINEAYGTIEEDEIARKDNAR